MTYQNLNGIFAQPLFSNKLKSSVLSKSEEDYIWTQARENLYAGFLLNKIDFAIENIELKNKLQRLSKNYFLKNFSMQREMFAINQKLKDEGIDAVFLKGMALNLAGIHSPNCRHCRDIDLLVSKKNLKQTYEHLKALNFTYRNEDCEDSCEYLAPMHHLPPLINAQGITVELHFRITSPQAFITCPLTDLFLNENQTVKGVKIPTNNGLILHAIYHGVIHNSLGDGPLFLMDLQHILNKCNLTFDIESVHSVLGIEKNILAKIDKILKKTKNKTHLDQEVNNLLLDLFNSKKLFCKQRKSRIGTEINIFTRMRRIKHEYQVSYFSFKYIKKLLSRIINLVKNSRL